MKKGAARTIGEMGYVELMAFLGEVNRPPGGKQSIRMVVQNCFITKDSNVLDIGCNTGYCAFEIAHLAKCHVRGIDVSAEMIAAARKIQKKDPLRKLVQFKIADATALPFRNGTFDVVISGGSTAFIGDKQKALYECQRVLKPWGFIADINFFYRNKPPLNLIRRLNILMGTDIESWDISYWLDLYSVCDLEKYLVFTQSIKPVSRKKVEKYCDEMVQDRRLGEKAMNMVRARLLRVMRLFNENHEYLSYGIFILRKRPTKEQTSLFGE